MQNFIKYINDESLATEHWEYCQRYHIPFISVKPLGKNKMEIFYDVTELDIDLERISEEVKGLFLAYQKFFLLDDYFAKNYLDQYYFFCFPVLAEHADCIATQLFEFLYAHIYT